MTKILSETEAMTLIEELEKENGLWSLRVHGCSPWRIVRFAVAVELQNLPFRLNRLPLTVLARSCLRSIRDIPRIYGNYRYAVKSFASSLREKTEVGYEDVYFEELLQKVPGGLRLYTTNAAGYHGRALAWSGTNIDVTLIVALGALLARIFPVKGSDQIFERVADAVASRISGDKFPVRRIRRMFSSFWWQSVLYKWLLRFSGVKTVLVADTGERALLRAARENGCSFIELQHGIFSPNHPDVLPSGLGLDTDDPGLLLPDIVAVYGKRWAELHSNRLLGACGRVRPVGASFIEKLRKSRKTGKSSNEVTRILVTTQGLARDQLIRFLREFLDSYRAPLRLDIKLHPTYDPSPVAYLEAFQNDNRVNVIPGNVEPNVYRLLVDCGLHVSISSACHYDALGLQIPTIVLALPSHEVVLDLVETGQALLVTRARQLTEILDGETWITVPDRVAADHYKAGFAVNLTEWIPIS